MGVVHVSSFSASSSGLSPALSVYFPHSLLSAIATVTVIVVVVPGVGLFALLSITLDLSHLTVVLRCF